MAGEDVIIMSQGDLKRLSVINKVLDRHLTQVSAADILGLSSRQIRRIAGRVSEEGSKGVIHRSRGRLSHNAIAVAVKKQVIGLCREVYDGFGPTLAAEKLFERDKIRISRETLRKWFKSERMPYQGRKKRPHRYWRERKEHYGQMIQMDGSHHKWFEERGPGCVLMGYIDDATGIPFGRFYAYEGTIPAMDSFKRYIRKRGIPVSVYLDKHSTYKSNRKPTIEDELMDQDPLSQFGRALKELGVELIHAHSAPAKGRIERLFKTFQDRVIKEMRLENICTIDEANVFLERYLPVYAKRFAVRPSEVGDLHRPVPKELNLDRILCIKTVRALRNDFTVAHDKKLYQLLDNVKAEKVVVEERINGSMIIRYKDAGLRFKEIISRPVCVEEKKASKRARVVRKPIKGHPWTRWIARGYPQNPQYSQKEKVGQKEKELLLVP